MKPIVIYGKKFVIIWAIEAHSAPSKSNYPYGFLSSSIEP